MNSCKEPPPANGWRIQFRRRAAVIFCQVALLVLLLCAWEFTTANKALNASCLARRRIWHFLMKMWKDGQPDEGFPA